jgi:transposase
LECLRPDVVAKRAAYLRSIRRVPAERLVFLDEAGVHLAMSRSHAWVKKGEEFIDRVPINWGKKTLTLIGAIRLSGWVVLTTMFATVNKDRFVTWLATKLLPKLRCGDVLVMDNLSAHHDARIAAACQLRSVRLIYLPPYSPDFNPIESGWALQKQFVRRHAPRQPDVLRRIARRARYRVTRRHCRNWFRHCGYRVQHR